MKKILTILMLTCILFTPVLLNGCGGCKPKQFIARNFGGTEKIVLESGEKLEFAGWKHDGSLWYLTRPMRPNEQPETHEFRASSLFGVFEGKVIFVERR